MYAPLAQLDRASGYGPEGRGFESLTAYQTKIIRTLSSRWEMGSDYFFILMPVGVAFRLLGRWPLR